MSQIQKYVWLIENIRRAGKISLKDLSRKWQSNVELSGDKPLHRATFNRWIREIYNQFNIIISCQAAGGYLYYIENPEAIEDDRLKKWMLDSFAIGNMIGENMDLKERILVDEIPSGHDFLTVVIEGMRASRVMEITYHSYHRPDASTFTIKPYCLKFFENRWYLLGFNDFYKDLRIYALDRIRNARVTDKQFKMPSSFNASEYFTNSYGIVVTKDHPRRIVLRAYGTQKHYLMSLPLHSSQSLIEDTNEYADFDMYLIPTYDFIMRLLQLGPQIEVLKPTELRDEVANWIEQMNSLYH